MDYKKKHDNLIIIAKGKGKDDAPSPKPSDCDIWSINDIIYERQDIDLLFETHKFEDYSKEQLNNVILANKLGIPVMMTDSYPNLEYVIRFPIEDISDHFKSDYFMTGIAYMMAYAIYLGYKKIEFYGCNMGGIGETYKNAKACVEYWIGRAHERGIEILLHGKYNQLLKTFDRRLYGYDKFQWLPESVSDNAMHITIGCTLSVKAERKLLHLLTSQPDSQYFSNIRSIPFTETDGADFMKRRPVEDAISFNIDLLRGHYYVRPKFVGDVALFYMYFLTNLMVVHHTFKLIYLTDDAEELKKQWLTYSQDYNFWTAHDSEHWNGDKTHARLDSLFPKFDLPKEEAFTAFHNYYHEKALAFKRDFPSHILLEDRHILDTEEGQRKILKFIGYEEDDMVITAEKGALWETMEKSQ